MEWTHAWGRLPNMRHIASVLTMNGVVMMEARASDSGSPGLIKMRMRLRFRTRICGGRPKQRFWLVEGGEWMEQRWMAMLLIHFLLS